MSRMNSVSDIIPLCAKAMEDKQWHGMAYFLKEVGESISFERAVRFYEGMGGGAAAASREGGDLRPLDERASSGRRRGIYLALSSLTDRNLAECKDKTAKVDDREYRMLQPLSEKPEKPAKPTKQPTTMPVKKPVRTAKTPDAQAVVEFLNDLDSASSGVFKIAQDREDWNMHMRHLRRIALMYVDPAPAVVPAAPAVLTPVAEPEKKE